jgi:dTDP-4-amino-4,6-dideoxygalactose transaminase
MTKIKFGELRLGKAAKENLLDCVRSNWITCGSKVEELEKRFASLFGYKHCIMTSSGTDADINAFLTLYETHDAKLGDEVIVPALAFIANSTSIIAAGLRPRHVDIKRETLLMDEDLVEAAIGSNTKAICAVSTMGRSPDMEKLRKIADKHNLALIVDHCEGHGAKWRGKYLRHYADMCTYSGYTAHLIVSGEAGFIGTDSDEIADILRSTRTHGRHKGDKTFNHVRLGYNSKPTDLHASIGLDQIPDFWRNINVRKENRRQIHKGLEQHKRFFYLSEDSEFDENSPHGISITLKDPKYNFKRFYNYMNGSGIECKLNFLAASQQPVFQKLLYLKEGLFPEAEYVGKNGLHFGCHAYLLPSDIQFIVDTIKKYFDYQLWEDRLYEAYQSK